MFEGLTMKFMNKDVQLQLSQRINRLRWWIPILAFLLILFHQLVEHTWLVSLPRWQHFATQLLFYGFFGPVLAWWALTSLRRSARDTEQAHQERDQAHVALEEANQRLEFLVRVNRLLAEAEDEEALIEMMLALSLEVVPAVGCSLIRFDERGQPMPVIHQGDIDLELLERWSTHLSTNKIRHECEQCSTRWAA